MIFQATLAFSQPNKKRRKQSIKTWKFVLKPPVWTCLTIIWEKHHFRSSLKTSELKFSACIGFVDFEENVNNLRRKYILCEGLKYLQKIKKNVLKHCLAEVFSCLYYLFPFLFE